MDIISHALLGASVVADKKLLLSALIFGAGPDLINGIPVHLFMIWKLKKENRSWTEIFQTFKTPNEWKKAPAWTHTLYLYLHSLWFALIVAAIAYLFYPPWLVLMKAWFLHIGLDFFLHRDWFGVKPFYPLNRWQLSLVNWFETPIKYLGLPTSLLIFIWTYWG